MPKKAIQRPKPKKAAAPKVRREVNNIVRTARRIDGRAANPPARRTGAPGQGYTPHQRMTDILTKQDVAMLDYLEMLADPDADPVGVPVVLGQFELFTNKYRVEYEGEATASTAGVAYVSLAADNWLDTDNNVGGGHQQFSAYNAGTQGNLIWYTPAGGTASGLPTGGQATNASHAAIPSVSISADSNAQTRMRVSSVNLEVWSDASDQTASGNVVLFVAENSEYVQNGNLSAATPSTIVATPQNVLKHETYPLAGWESGERAHTFLVPWDENCFAMATMPATGSLTCGNLMLGAIGTGMATGQTFRFRVVVTYETTANKTYQTNVAVRPTVHVETSQMMDHLPGLKTLRPTVGPKAELAHKGAAAWYSGLPPTKQPAAEVASRNPGLLSSLVPVAKEGLGWLANKIPIIGQGLGSLLNNWL